MRFASVYKEFSDIKEFMSTLLELVASGVQPSELKRSATKKSSEDL